MVSSFIRRTRSYFILYCGRVSFSFTRLWSRWIANTYRMWGFRMVYLRSTWCVSLGPTSMNKSQTSLGKCKASHISERPTNYIMHIKGTPGMVLWLHGKKVKSKNKVVPLCKISKTKRKYYHFGCTYIRHSTII